MGLRRDRRRRRGHARGPAARPGVVGAPDVEVQYYVDSGNLAAGVSRANDPTGPALCAAQAGYSADVLRVDSSPVPWVVRVSGYSTREQAESARDALARKGFRGGFIL